MSKVKILIVDDYKENIQALAGLVAGDGVEIYSASNADEALEQVDQHEFGLLLLDVQMPGTSGFELAKVIRSVKKYRSLPIIFVTAQREDSSVIFEGYKTGAVDILFKPLDVNMVRAKVQMFVEMAQQKSLMQEHVKELERLRIEADAANVAKTQFLANMSHEIRTPLAAVMGFAELITKSQPDNSETRELSAAVERNGKLLLRLIDDILDLTKVEANKLELERVDFDMSELLQDISSTLSFRAKEKGLILELKVPERMSGRYVSDPARIKQVLLNIIGNAIKFTRVGAVEVEVSVEPALLAETARSKNIDTLSVSVKDQGIGLTTEQAERLFQPFGQADSSTRRHFGGSGLGLVISRQIARAMGGDIKLAGSEPGKGSTFQIKLNLEKNSADSNALQSLKNVNTSKEPEGPAPVSFTGKRILAVDDSPDNLNLITYYLKKTGALLSFASNGFEAITEVKQNEFDIILMDIQMPGMDGHEATEEIRRLGFKNPILALTAHAIRSEHDKCKASGCDGVLTKPISSTALMKKLNEYLR